MVRDWPNAAPKMVQWHGRLDWNVAFRRTGQEVRMAIAQRMSEEDYKRFVLTGAEGAWELHDGRLVEKPGMTWNHGSIVAALGRFLLLQLDWDEHQVRFNEGRVRKPLDTIFIPDILVIPLSYGDEFRDRPILAIFSEPALLVIEVWSPSTGDYDVDVKLPVYQQRGDREIWRIHPYERTLTRWQRLPDGSYEQTLLQGGAVTPIALPNVTIDLDRLFAL
jgi:Uma2 family endonuclease